MSLNVELLQQSFERIKLHANEFAANFYENLFVAHPEVKPLFAGTNMEKQQKKLLNALTLVVESLRNPEVLAEVLNALGARHISYGAIPKYYPAVGQALLTTFEQSLQEDWTPELNKAWADAYQAITAQMLKASSGVHSSEATDPKAEAVTVSQKAIAATVAITPRATDIPEAVPASLPIELLEQSFEKIKPHADEFAASFYENLFNAYPELKPLFATVDMAKQQKKLLNALVLVVENLRNPEALGEVLSALGARHVGYGTIPKQYPAVEQALLKALEQQLRTEWTPELKQAWARALKVITAQMVKGSAQHSTPTNDFVSRNATIRPETAIPSAQSRGNRRDIKPVKRRLSRRRWSASPKQVVRSIINTFWETPAWLIALITVIVMTAVFSVTDEKSRFAKILGGIEAISILVALVLFVKEAPDRKKQFHYQAWSIIDAAHGVNVSYARVLALQDLNEDGVSLRGLNAPGAEIAEIQLSKANLSQVDLSAADLSNANLNQANLNKANLCETKLSGANLSSANLSFAQLSRANLSSANLSSANLICADLSSANLSGADLRNASLSGANLTEAYLTGANLTGAKVSISELQTAFLEGVTMPDGSKYRSQN
jgi:hemoglobin-like flavoprotein/uncharacterized protein YjbI with pentapeptide repeats